MVVHIQEAGNPLFGERGELVIAAGGADISRGDILAYDGVNVSQADADAVATFAHFIALRQGQGSTNDPLSWQQRPISALHDCLPSPRRYTPRSPFVWHRFRRNTPCKRERSA